MAILNRIVNILILLLVITAGVFSFMLFDKRTQLTDGMKQMASAINKTAGVLDRDTGTRSAANLDLKSMEHTNYANFKTVLPKLEEQAKKVMEQRNALAKTLVRISERFGFKHTLEEFTNVNNSKASSDKLLKELEGVKNHRDNVGEAFAEVGKKLGASVSAADFAPNGNYEAAAVKIKGQIDSIYRERNIIRSDVNAASRAIGNGNYNYLKTNDFKAALRRHSSMVSKLRSDLNAAQRLNRNNDSKIKIQEKTIEGLNAKISELTIDVKELNDIITADGKKPVLNARLTADSPECYKKVFGKVSYVSSEYGFIQLDIGKNYVIEQEYGASKNRVSFPLQSGLVMTVTRGIGEGAVIIGKVLVKTVNGDNSICNIIKGNVSDFKVGDDVYFGPDDIKKIPAAAK